jgi:uncharacterized membrane protein YjgN (DUF898 family)
MALTGETDDRVARVEFTGTRGQLFGLLFRGYLLMLPTVGIYRFWVTTWKRRFYWQNTLIDGEPLEYSGSALQLLIGFLFAVAFFLPLYIAFFYLSTQSSEIAGLGYGVIAAVFWFMMGYAQFRARDFRLSRTLWRGIRFAQHGNAWAYALRRFLWSLLVVVTLGLAYPAMMSSLWRYRYTHTWYGDRQFRWTGTWKTIAGPYYISYLLIGAAVLYALYVAVTTPPIFAPTGGPLPGPAVYAAFAGVALVAGLVWFYFRARESTRMFSEVWIGEARVTVRVKARALFGQFVIYLVALLGAAIVIGIAAGIIVATLFSSGAISAPGTIAADIARAAQTSWVVLPLLVLGYLVILGTFGLLAEVFLGAGYWMLVARGASLANPDSLRTVRATDEDRALAGEGLADALNVGAY